MQANGKQIQAQYDINNQFLSQLDNWENPKEDQWCSETVACARKLGVELDSSENSKFIKDFLKEN